MPVLATLRRWMSSPVPLLVPHTLMALALLGFASQTVVTLDDAPDDFSLLVPFVYINLVHCLAVWLLVLSWRFLIGPFLRPVETEVLQSEVLWYFTWRVIFFATQLHGDNILFWMMHLAVYCYTDMMARLLTVRLKHTPQTSRYPTRTHLALLLGLVFNLGIIVNCMWMVCGWPWGGICELVIALLMLILNSVKTIQGFGSLWSMYKHHIVPVSVLDRLGQHSTLSFQMCELIKEGLYTLLYTILVAYLGFFMNLYSSGFSLSVSPGSLIAGILLRMSVHRFTKLEKQRRNYVRVVRSLNERCRPATPEELRDSEDNCAICWEKFIEETTGAVRLPCGHFFHIACLVQWMEHDVTCPTCRRSLLEDPAPPPPAETTAPIPDTGSHQRAPADDDGHSGSDTTGSDGDGEADGAAADGHSAAAATSPRDGTAAAPAAGANPQARATPSRAQSFILQGSMQIRYLPRISFGMVMSIGGDQPQRIVLQAGGAHNANAGHEHQQHAGPATAAGGGEGEGGATGGVAAGTTAAQHQHPPERAAGDGGGEGAAASAGSSTAGQVRPERQTRTGLSFTQRWPFSSSANTSQGAGGSELSPQISRMAEQIQQMFPNVAHSAIMADLTDTQDMEETINNILDGYVASSAAATNASDTDATISGASTSAAGMPGASNFAHSLLGNALAASGLTSPAPSRNTVRLPDMSVAGAGGSGGGAPSTPGAASGSTSTDILSDSTSMTDDDPAQLDQFQFLHNTDPSAAAAHDSADIQALEQLLATPPPPATEDGMHELFLSHRHEMLQKSRRRYLERLKHSVLPPQSSMTSSSLPDNDAGAEHSNAASAALLEDGDSNQGLSDACVAPDSALPAEDTSRGADVTGPDNNDGVSDGVRERHSLPASEPHDTDQ